MTKTTPPMDTDKLGFAERLNFLLADREKSQQAIADLLQITRAAVNDWCRGRSTPAPDTVFALERALGVAPGELSRELGYLPVAFLERKDRPSTVETIMVDPKLSDDGRQLLVMIYERLSDPRLRHGLKEVAPGRRPRPPAGR